MATNADSARQWLSTHNPKPSELLHIVTKLQDRLANMDADHPDFTGNLEALDVLEQAMAPTAPMPTTSPSLDSTPLVDYDTAAPAQEVADKRAQFASLKQQLGQALPKQLPKN